MKLKIKNKKIILEDSQFDLSGMIKPLVNVGEFLSSSLFLAKDLTSFGFKIGWAGIVNSISPSGSWEDFRKRVKDLKKTFDESSKKTLDSLDNNTSEMIRNSGLSEKEVNLILAGGAPAIFLAEKIFNSKKNNRALDSINKIADMQKDSDLGEGYKVCIFKVIFSYYLQKKPSSAEKKYSDCYTLIEQAVQKIDGGDFKSFLNSVCKNNASLRYEAVNSIFSSIKDQSQKGINEINENNAEKIKSRILTAFSKNFSNIKEATNEDYKVKIRMILLIVAFIIIKHKDFEDINNEIKAKLLESVPGEAKDGQADVIISDLNSLALIVHYSYSILNGAISFLDSNNNDIEEKIKSFINKFKENNSKLDLDFTNLVKTKDNFLKTMSKQINKDDSPEKVLSLIISLADATLEEFKSTSAQLIKATEKEYEEIIEKMLSLVSEEKKEKISTAQNNLKAIKIEYNKVMKEYGSKRSNLESQLNDEQSDSEQ